MTYGKFLELTKHFKLTDEIVMLVDAEIVDILSVERGKTENPRFNQHRAIIIPNYRDVL